MGQVKKTQQQIQNELDEMHHLISIGYSDENIMKKQNMPRLMFYRYKKRLYQQTARVYEQKRQEDIFYDIQICKERLQQDRILAESMARDTHNPLWGQLAAELTVSILKLEHEGIQALNNGRLRRLEEKTRPLILDSRGQPATVLEVQPEPSEQQSTNDERQF